MKRTSKLSKIVRTNIIYYIIKTEKFQVFLLLYCMLALRLENVDGLCPRTGAVPAQKAAEGLGADAGIGAGRWS
ncbi:MAG: hypothetical protein J5878_06855, partial [Oscillospiraceae bacterium]|nr:hypothetical protein [Oscillospiraceae bacterium]